MEIEMKIPLKAQYSPENVMSNLLNEFGSTSEEISQTDYYFSSPIHNFAITDEALRVRQIRGKSGKKETEITYKGPKQGKSMKIREEITILTYSNNVQKFLQCLGFSLFGVVKKKRMNWFVDDLVISLDEVEDLGFFMEIEITTLSENSENIFNSKERIIRIVKKLIPDWAGEDERKSYLELKIAKQFNAQGT
ncbi:MAG: class IV adenylate cyclase [Candidatus Heimdallarchaeota archaeon]|nr:MAG: class IV adenylate cyclase [Candidatus Heimdallarchaeota archaeon]